MLVSYRPADHVHNCVFNDLSFLFGPLVND